MGKFKNIYLDTPGGKWLRKVAHHRYHMIEMLDLPEWSGDDFGYRYAVELSEIDLDMMTEKEIESARKSCGWEGMDTTDPEMIAEMLHSYGLRAPIEAWNGNNWRKQFKEARKFSYELDNDLDRHEEIMNRPVNALGSTAREYMQGDLRTGMLRGISEDNTDAKIMGKMHGYSDEMMEKMKSMTTKVNAGQFNLHKIPSDDPIPYMMGFMAGFNSARMEDDRENTVPDYFDGYKFGVSVRCGDNPWPEWAK